MKACEEETPFAFQIKNINDLSSQNKLQTDLYKNSAFIKASVQILQPIQHIFVEVTENGSPIGLLLFQVLPFKGKELSAYLPKEEKCLINKTIEAIVDMALDRINWKLLVLGNVFFTGDNGQIWHKDIQGKLKWQLIRKAAKTITQHTKIDAFLITDIYDKDLQEDAYLLKHSYRKFEVEPDLIFTIQNNWKTFDDYLQSLFSKYRVRTNKVFEKASDLEIKTLSLGDVCAQNTEMLTLYKNVIEKADFKLAEIPNNYFIDFKEALGTDFQIRTYNYQGKCMGFISYFIGKETLHINFVGLDYSMNKELCVYQRILYDCIEQGILLGKKEIHFGRTATEIKTAVGAQPHNVYAYLKHVSTIPNLAIKPLTTYLKPEPFEARNPFKSA